MQVNLATGVNTGGEAAGDTITNVDNVTGSDFADTLAGNANANVLTGGKGDDQIDGGGGIDTMVGGLGNDTYVVDTSSDAVVESAGEGDGPGRPSATRSARTSRT
ncbi:hypothetical protein AB5I41_07755 [Sphingomonas sp. MMS24-JH45]